MHSEKKVLKETTPYFFTEQKGFQKPINCQFIRNSELLSMNSITPIFILSPC